MNSKQPGKNIALFSHSSWSGGAETAFVNLVNLVEVCGFNPIVFLPTDKGDLFGIFKSKQINVYTFNITSIYGSTSNGLLEFSQKNLNSIEKVLLEEECSLVITNSSTYVDGALAAANLGLPHIWSIHEMQQKNPEQFPGGVADGAFARWFAALSDHQIFCSNSTRAAHESALITAPHSTVLPPFLESAYHRPTERISKIEDSVVNLMFIGAPTVRKNPTFAIEILAALRGRGRNACLNFIGGRRDKTGLIGGLLKRRGLKSYVNFLGKLDDPYSCFKGTAINLICSKSEPFGLTVPESLSRGIPVVAPNIDGPSENLNLQYQFDLENLDQCVRLIESVVDNYEESSRNALANYESIRHRFQFGYQKELVVAAIGNAFHEYKPKKVPYELTIGAISKAVNPDALSLDGVIGAISKVSNHTEKTIRLKVEAEQKDTGSSVSLDVKAFDVVPYQPSEQMDELYRSGLSFAIELAASYQDHARLKMAAFILVRLCTERERLGRNLKILAVGDGIGADSIRLASAGFDVHYMDYEASVTSKVAAENFRRFKEENSESESVLLVRNRDQIESGSYDAVISLEVIEHVEKPHDFLRFLYDQLQDRGILFLSDCFPGIKNYWQTHLLSNEKMAGLIPLMAAQNGFSYLGACQDPMCKPYVFERSSYPVSQLVGEVLTDAYVMQGLVHEQFKLIKPRARKVDRLLYAFKRISINLKGYFALIRLSK